MILDKNLVFIVGPSGIGKTTILKYISADLGYDAISLDDLVAKKAKEANIIDEGNAYQVLKKLGSKSLFLFGLRCLFGFLEKKGDEKILIDVGAAFQDNTIFSHISNFYYVVCLTAEPNVAHKRYCEFRGGRRDFKTHCFIEFSSARVEVYNSSHFIIDSTRMNESQSAIALKKIIMNMGKN